MRVNSFTFEMEYAVKKSAKYQVLDLFSGAGGFSCGLDMLSDFHTVVALDFEKSAIETFKKNFPDAKCICGNICETNIKKEVVKYAQKKRVNMIIGGPPCQGFSLKGKNLGLDDPRNFLFLEYWDLVNQIRPSLFVIENVKNLIADCGGFFIKQIYEKFEKLGYTLNHGILKASDFGVPQNRERAIIIGYKGIKKISLPTRNVKNEITVREAISDLAYLNSGEGEDCSEYKNPAVTEYQKRLRKGSKKLHNHKATNHSDIALKKLRMIPPEGDKTSMPSELYGRQQFATTWARLQWDKPSPTIDTRFDTPSNGRNSHPILDRSITPREAARIQSFPDKFVFYGKKCAICKQIGNAVPPLLAKALGEHLIKELENNE